MASFHVCSLLSPFGKTGPVALERSVSGFWGGGGGEAMPAWNAAAMCPGDKHHLELQENSGSVNVSLFLLHGSFVNVHAVPFSHCSVLPSIEATPWLGHDPSPNLNF